MKQAVVTGAYGFIGRHLCRELAKRGVVVRGLGHGTWSQAEWRAWGLADWRTADITIDALMTYAGAPDALFHCAGSGSVAFSMTNPYLDYERTVGTAAAVLEFVRRQACGARLVIPSSAAVYGVAARLPIAVDDPLAPLSPYGVHKRIVEDLCRSSGTHSGVPCAIVRLFSVYGTGLRKQLLWDACCKIDRGDCGFAGDGTETRDWIHVEDVARLLIAAAGQASAACPVVNGACGIARDNRAVLALLAGGLGASRAIAFSGIRRSGDPQHYHADISGALGWGWAPRQTFEDGIGAYARWYREGAP